MFGSKHKTNNVISYRTQQIIWQKPAKEGYIANFNCGYNNWDDDDGTELELLNV